MRRSVIAIFLCISAATAGAQCVTRTPAAAGTAHPGAELIKTSAARGHEPTLPVDDGLPAAQVAPMAKRDEEPPRRAGPAMLLAAVAVMSGIALRRYSSRMQ